MTQSGLLRHPPVEKIRQRAEWARGREATSFFILTDKGEDTVSDEQSLQRECEATFELLRRRYGDRLTPEMLDGLRGAVQTVVKTVTAVRSVRLANGDAPLTGFAPIRREE